jgi:hypothetical protein
MDSAVIDRIETSAGRGASALFAAAAAYATYGLLLTFGVSAELGICAAGAGALSYLPCSRLLSVAGRRSPRFDLRSFELRDLELTDAADELLLTDADRLGSSAELVLTDADRLRARDELVLTDADRFDPGEPLLLDDILAEIGTESRVVRLFDRKAMPTPGQLRSRIANHLGQTSPVEAPADAAQALSDALAELRRSLG